MNRWLSRGSVLICLISLCGIAWAMQGQTEAPPAAQPDPAAEAMKIDAKADAILRELSSFYRGLEQGTVNATAAVKVNRYGQDMTLDVDYTFSWRRPNRFTMQATAARFNGEAAPVGDYNGEAICDGEHFYLHVPMLKSYVMKEAPESFEGLVDGDAEMAFLSASGGTELQILISLLSDDPYAQLMQAASGLHYVGEEIVNEQKLHHLRVESEEVDVHLWIHQGDQPWLHRAKPDLQRYYDQMAEKTASMLKLSLDALVNMDLDLSLKVLTLDDEVDEIHGRNYDKIKAAIQEQPEEVGYFINFFQISRHLERIADHATNIAEEVVYMIEGEIVRHGKWDRPVD